MAIGTGVRPTPEDKKPYYDYIEAQVKEARARGETAIAFRDQDICTALDRSGGAEAEAAYLVLEGTNTLQSRFGLVFLTGKGRRSDGLTALFYIIPDQT